MNNPTHIDALDYTKDVATRMESVSIKEYFLRRDRKTKWLIEEEWPLACFGKILYHPDRRIKVLYRGPDGVPDGEIIVEGRQKSIEEWEDVTPVEITSVQYTESHLVRKELGTMGSFVGSARDVDDDIKRFIPEAIECLRKKYDHQPPYPQNSIIVCAIFPEKSFGRLYWNMLLDGISEQLADVKYKTVILDTFTCQHFVMRAS